jgi:ureidoglycolate amidohydrolase
LRAVTTATRLHDAIDAVGNLFCRWAGGEPDAPLVLTGSHVDTTLNAGRFDGVVGVLGAIAAVHVLRDERVAPRRSIELVAWAGEEPRFPTGCVGSRAAAGRLERADLDRLVDRDGTSMAEALRGAGFDPDRLPEAEIDPARVHALVELHIEQGAVLEHGGEAMTALERIARESPSGTTVGRVGVLRVRPGAINVVPGEVELDVDVLDSDLAAREEVVAAADAARELGVPFRRIISGAYHDAMIIGARVPIGMIFVPSAGGISHHPDEFTDPDDIQRGVRVLAGTLARLAA